MGSDAAGSRGAFILFEGGDRCGKSTQCKLLVEHLSESGTPAELWSFPDRTTAVGGMIDAYLSSKTDLDDAAIHLLFSANRWEKHKRMLETLRQGTTLVVDRFAFSGAAFTAAKGVPGLNLDWCKAPDRGLLAPDVVLFLAMHPAAAASRDGFGDERYEKLAFQRQVQQQFETLRNSSWRRIDAAQSVEDVQQQVLTHARAACEQAAAGAPLTLLWHEPPFSEPVQETESCLTQ